MRLELPVIWTFRGETCTGRVELARQRVTLSSRHETVSFETGAIATFAIERAPAQRLRGLPVLSLRLVGGDVIRIASLGGVGSLHELATRIVPRHSAAASGT